MNERWILVIIPAVSFAFVFLRSWLKERNKNRQPIIQIKAEITDIRLQSRTVNGAYGRTNLIGHYVTFRTADGELLELSAPADVGHQFIGTAGILTYQGSKCERFDADKSE